MRVTPNDNMTIEIYNEAYTRQISVSQLFYNLLQRSVSLIEPNTTPGLLTVPFAALINIIERNIDTLAADGYMPQEMKSTRNWQGGENDDPRLSYFDVNRWFESMELLERLIHGIANRRLITGTYSTGGDRTRQTLRTV